LGFSIATAWAPDILILDEVLAVGDAHFIVKCRHRLADLRGSGTALLLVSHDLDAVRKTCDRCLWIDGGRIAAEGPAGEVADRYEAALQIEEGEPAAAEAVTTPSAARA
jgi:lipopolysaccharide transport system ATP-binding protein